jgi:hypothetical protein
MRIAVDLNQKSRRGIRFHYNERYEGKREKETGMFTSMRRQDNRHVRVKAKHALRAFHGVDWEEFEIPADKGGLPLMDYR